MVGPLLLGAVAGATAAWLCWKALGPCAGSRQASRVHGAAERAPAPAAPDLLGAAPAASVAQERPRLD
jgi:hypothetical protein